jgi:hypothetical protein
MSTSAPALLNQLLACGPDDKRAIFESLARDLFAGAAPDHSVPITGAGGEIIGVYWPHFVSHRKSPPNVPESVRAELLRRHAERDDADDIELLLN